MKAQEKAAELIKKFGGNALDVLEETFIVWNIKRKHELDKLNSGNRSENVLRGLNICDTTLNYWKKVKNIIENEQRT